MENQCEAKCSLFKFVNTNVKPCCNVKNCKFCFTERREIVLNLVEPCFFIKNSITRWALVSYKNLEYNENVTVFVYSLRAINKYEWLYTGYIYIFWFGIRWKKKRLQKIKENCICWCKFCISLIALHGSCDTASTVLKWYPQFVNESLS